MADRIVYLSLYFSVWFEDGEIVMYAGAHDKDARRIFARQVLKFEMSNDNLPEYFFDEIVDTMKADLKEVGGISSEYINEEYTGRLQELYDNRDKAHNLIFDSDWFSVKESDYFTHRDLFPVEWEECFKPKDYIFYVNNEKKGYYQIRDISAMDAKLHFEHDICGNTEWERSQCWDIGMNECDYESMIPAVTDTKRERFPGFVRMLEAVRNITGFVLGDRCLGRYEYV